MSPRLPSLRALAAVAVLTAWAVALTLLGLRSLGQGGAADLSNEASLRLSPTASWFAVYSGPEQVGSAGITLDTLSPGYRIRETVTMEVPAAGALARASRLTESHLSASLTVEAIRSRFSLGDRQHEWTLSPTHDTLTVGYAAGTLQFGSSATTPTPAISLSAALYRLALTGGLAPGRSREVLVFEGWPPAARATTFQVGRDSVVSFADSAAIDPATGMFTAAHRDSVAVTEVRVNSPLGPHRLWVDRRGAIAGVDWPLGVRWVRSDFDLAVQAFRRAAPGREAGIRMALGNLTPLAAPGTLPDTSRRERRFRIDRRDGGTVSGALMVQLGGGRQALLAGVMRVSPEAPTSPRTPRADGTYDPLVQESAAEIQTAADRATAGTTGMLALDRLAEAIPRMAVVDTSATAPEDALGTLRAHRGRPDGLARLYVALARARGADARYVVGVAPRGDTLLTHAWAEVRDPSSNAWTAVDPVFGRARAGTGLIRLAFAGSSHPDDLRTMLAQARFTSLDSTEAP
ncbi:MAG: transglutaminase-like domain-containing protein [Gemmatimonadota bacterium]